MYLSLCFVIFWDGSINVIFPGRIPKLAKKGGEATKNLVERFDTEFNPDFSAKSPNFRGLVLFCIEADFCTQIRILQHFSRTTRFAILCTASISKFELNFVKIFRIFPKILQKNAIFQRFSSNFAPILINISRNFAEYSKK